ncbi:hypothetical protein [Photobacterium galatheae]|uniref:Lipoprotein n=1 Tax=Photobacterium galatheae TaxID=1654360 RepID=A0A066RMQ5_9GAMM|nr:hypothetical protein [Photobacterium galatheae]KDM91629.1 hypothetical protein EA58_11450 [Photobacterium galatheae]MCM0149703.1 hypothetical protein [Photobacterium galatheae]
MRFHPRKGAVIPGLLLMVMTGCTNTESVNTKETSTTSKQRHYIWVDEPGNEVNPLAVKAAKQVCGYETYVDKKYNYQKYQMFLCMEKLGVYYMTVPDLPDYE